MIFSDLYAQSIDSVELESILFSFICDNPVKYNLHLLCCVKNCISIKL